MPRPYAEPVTRPAGVGQAWQDVIAMPNPAAGTEISYTVEGQYIVRPLALTFQLAASAVAGTRFPSLRYVTGNNELIATSVISTGIGQSATGRASYWLGANAVAPAGFGIQVAALPDIVLSAGQKIVTVTAGIAAGDQFSLVVLTLERYYSDFHRGPRPRGHIGGRLR